MPAYQIALAADSVRVGLLAPQKLPDRSGGLTRTVLVLNQGKAYETFSRRPEPDARRNRHERLFHKQL